MSNGGVDILADSVVAVAAGYHRYGRPPYSPSDPPPEYPFGQAPADGGGDVYVGVRTSLELLGLDLGEVGSAEWNPLGSLIRPGETVVIKPNFVRHFRQSSDADGDCLITHGAVIRAVIDYVYIALAGRGRIVVADAPQSDADFEAIARIVGLDSIVDFYARNASIPVEVHDLRTERAHKINGVIVGHTELPGDPARYTQVNLGGRSALAEVDHLNHLLYGSEYDMGELHRHHRGQVHEYLIARTVLDADVIINVPKLKTHKKVGLTACMKNLVGINGNKNWLPHHRQGTPAQGGDQFADDRFAHRIERRAADAFKRVFPWLGWARPRLAGPLKALGTRVFGDTDVSAIRSGNWHGNDTAWRMVVDLVRVALYADADGGLNDRPLRRMLNIVDGVVAGQGNGPLDATAKHAGVVLAGRNPAAVDTTCARLMGFDEQKIRMLRRVFDDHPLPVAAFGVDRIDCRSNQGRFAGRLTEWAGPMMAFDPHFGWRNHVEWSEPADGMRAALRATEACEMERADG